MTKLLNFRFSTMALLMALLLSSWGLAQDADVETAPTASDAAATDVVAAEPASPAPQTQTPSLEQAYQREFAFLQGQKADLERRLSELRSRIDAEKRELQGEIRDLEASVIDLRGQGDRLDNLVFESERAVETAMDNTDLLASTFLQADFTLDEAYEPTHGEQAPRTDDVAALFSAASGVLDHAGKVSRGPGEFFLADGTRVSGDIIKIGRIAAYGLSSQGQGALAPAGDGELKIWPEPSGVEVAEALAA
ncbi:MAG: hypothetical protein AAGJ52_14740, partial [Pseudomonadota bacterium]